MKLESSKQLKQVLKMEVAVLRKLQGKSGSSFGCIRCGSKSLRLPGTYGRSIAGNSPAESNNVRPINVTWPCEKF